MIKISVIGFGNVGRHLAEAFEKATNIELSQIFSRSEVTDSPSFSTRIVNDLAELSQADLYIVAVSDKSVAEVCEALPFSGRLVAHTAGSLSLDAIGQNNRQGVFYSLQTFSKAKSVDFSKIPVCIEAREKGDLDLLETVARELTDSVYKLDSGQRKALHVSAVFASNFTNHMYKLASDICREHEMPFDILKPLIVETADKILTLAPDLAQTGPAKRRDNRTIESHLSLLDNVNQRSIYTILTQSIQHE